MENTINFACKKIPIEQIIKCAFNINTTDYLILKLLLNSKTELNTQHIKKKIYKDRTTIQKSIKNLLNLKLITRRQLNLSSGGFEYIYQIKDKKEIKELIYKNFKSWEKIILKTLENW